MEGLISTLQFLSITPNEHPFIALAVFGVIFTYYFHARNNKILDKRFVRIEKQLECLEPMKRNIKVLATFLSSIFPDNFDTQLLEAMSPLEIKPQGYKLLEESGFSELMKEVSTRGQLFAYIDEQEPHTKLDVENYSLMGYMSIFAGEEMNKVKAYLYQKPHIREDFPKLASVLIRDEYLKVHPEIKS